MGLPSEAASLIALAKRERERSIEGKYNLVFIFSQLQRKGGNYWRQYGCNSVEELLTRLDLPISATLQNWTVIVELFSKETILTLGEESVFLLRRLVSNAQPDTELRKRDYQAIFDAYSQRHGEYDKINFQEIVNWYINTHYVKPSGIKVDDTKASPPNERRRGVHTIVRISPAPASQSAPVLTNDFRVEKHISAFQRMALDHIALLEQTVRSLGGRVPPRPVELRDGRNHAPDCLSISAPVTHGQAS